MSDLTGGVRRRVGDRDIVLVLDINALCDFETEQEAKASELIGRLRTGCSLTFLREFMRAGLVRHWPEVTMEDAGEVIGGVGGALEATLFILEAVTAAFPVKQAGPGPGGAARPPRTRKKAGTG